MASSTNAMPAGFVARLISSCGLALPAPAWPLLLVPVPVV